jgi:branched-chain amino acid aminotransferase
VAVVYLDGELVSPEDATVSAFDHGLLVGDGVFETLIVRAGRPFALRRHLDRLERSAKGLGIEMPERPRIEEAVVAVASALGNPPEARLRITLTSGAGPLSSQRLVSTPTLIVAANPLPPPSETAAVAVVPWPRNERSALTGIKSTSYAENVVALAWAHERGAGEAIFGNTAGNLCEGAGSNVFVVREGRLITPPVSAGLLTGVTRELLLELVSCDETDVPLDAFVDGAFDEAFLTSTTRRVQPIHAVNGRALSGVPGPVTAEAAARLTDLMDSTDDP